MEQEVPRVHLGDFVTAMLVANQDADENAVVRLIRGVVIWDHGNGTIQVTTALMHTYVCIKAEHPIIWSTSQLAPDELAFVKKMRRELIASAYAVLAHLSPSRTH